MAKKTDRFKEVWLTYPDIDKLFDDFNSLYKRMDAAGGIVINKDANDIYHLEEISGICLKEKLKKMKISKVPQNER